MSTKWEKISVPDHIVRCLQELEMSEPTPIQQATIPAAIDDRLNIYGAAPTGSGKTLAFAIPIVTHIFNDKTLDQNGSLKSIMLTPTRELAVQIKNHVENICKYNQIKVALIVGGLAIQKQERILSKKRPDILVATPGRLWEIITNGNISYLNKGSLANLKYLVIDEADRMIEQAHFKELRFIIEFIKESTLSRNSLQVFIFSATLTMIKNRKNKLKKQNDAENLIKLLNIEQSKMKICDLTEGGIKSKPSSEQLKESIIHCLKNDKDLYLYYFIIQNPGRTIIFFNSISCIRRLLNIYRFLQLNPLVIHSSMPQKRRLVNIEKFSLSKNSLLFATDVAARGLDLPKVNHVIHFQVPRTADTYVHRSGRTARLNNKGQSLILCDPKEDAFFLRNFSRIIKKETLVEYDNINSKILRQLKDRIKLAQTCDSLEHKLRKNRTETNWFQTVAKQCEIIYNDSDSDMDNYFDEDDNGAIREKKANERKLQQFQKQLNQLLRTPIRYSI